MLETTAFFEMAKASLLTDGKLAPMMYVEYTDNEGVEALSMLYFADWGADTPLEEHRQMYDYGIQFAADEEHATIQKLTMIAEAWVSSTITPEAYRKRTWKRPSDDPARREVLLAQIVELMPTPDGTFMPRQRMIQAEMVRSQAGIDLLPAQEETGEIASTTLPLTFYRGYRQARILAEQLKKAEKSPLN